MRSFDQSSCELRRVQAAPPPERALSDRQALVSASLGGRQGRYRRVWMITNIVVPYSQYSLSPIYLKDTSGT